MILLTGILKTDYYNTKIMERITHLIPMVDFVLHLRGMTTSELCNTYPERFKMPVWSGSKSEMVKAMLAIDAIKLDMIGNYAKFIKQNLTLGMFVPVDNEGKILEEPDPISIGSCINKRLRLYEPLYDEKETEI